MLVVARRFPAVFVSNGTGIGMIQNHNVGCNRVRFAQHVASVVSLAFAFGVLTANTCFFRCLGERGGRGQKTFSEMCIKNNKITVSKFVSHKHHCLDSYKQLHNWLKRNNLLTKDVHTYNVIHT